MLLASTMFLALLMPPAPAEDAIVLDLGNEPATDEAVDFSGTDLQPAPEGPDMQPTVVCLLIPQCNSNADCRASCGTEGARCVHSKCPARVCRC